MPFVKCQDLACGYNGFIDKKEIPDLMDTYRREAVRLIEKREVDHVVYGVKVYDDEGSIKLLRLYMEPMDDDEFFKRTGAMYDAYPGCYIAAVHKK